MRSQGISQRGIAASCQCSHNTVSAVLKRADERGISWPFERNISDSELQEILFPEKNLSTSKKVPDCEYIHKEIAKSGVALGLLWNEYCEQCRLSNEIPLMYSQFCRYYRKYASTQKTTMNIRRKPREQIEVDWGGQIV